MLRVNGLQHVPDPWRPSSEDFGSLNLKTTQLVLRGRAGRADPFEPLNRLNPLLLHIAGQNIEEKLPMGMPEG